MPESVSAGELSVCGVTIRCHVLADGRRVLEPVEAVLELLFGMPTISQFEAEQLVRFVKGED